MLKTTIAKRMREAYERTREPWGGATLFWQELSWVPDGINAYAVTVKDDGVESISIPADASLVDFNEAFIVAAGAFKAPYLGIFHDAVRGVIEFDPVMVVITRTEVDELAKTHNVVGGAYNFASGQGYWPQGRPAEYEVAIKP